MKNYLVNTWYMYVISFVFCYMLFLYEPLLMYMNNPSDFWFDFSVMLKESFFWFFIIYLIIIFLYNIVYFCNKKESKKIFNYSIVVMFIVFVCSYIQGNYLIGNLPGLDGTPIEWANYSKYWYFSIAIWLFVIGIVIFAIKKISLKKVVKYFAYVSLAIFLMLGASLFSTYFSQKESMKKEFISLTTYKNITKYSENKNFVILLLDAVDSKSFMDRLNKDNNYVDLLKDFTYYPDTMSGHPFTDESIPFILTGHYYHNEEPIISWATKAYKDSYLFDLIEKNDYELNVYESSLFYNDSSAKRIANLYNNDGGDIKKSKFFVNELKYIAFKYFPSFLKKYSRIEKMSFDASTIRNDIEVDFYNGSNTDFVSKINTIIEKNSKNNFKFIHLDGAHVPFTINKYLESIDNATYFDEVDSCITITKKYLDMLKDNNLYNNTAIIILADHGYNPDNTLPGRQNPILFVKGFNETNNKMKVSDKPIHFMDLNELYSDLIDGKKSNEVFANIPDKRKRNYLLYEFDKKELMIEYETNDKAWETKKMKPTGKEYKR